MLNKIIEFSAKNKFLIFLITAGALVAGIYAVKNIPLDAIPDLSDTQVIIYSRWDRSPDILEDQVTYPIVTAMLGVPKVKAVRGFSDFGFSYVYIIFQDGTDPYWARSRTLEYLSKILPKLPAGVQTELGPDATGVGWVYQYALVDRSGKNSLADLRSYQDWTLRYQLQAVPGVAEVASIGGFQKQYQIQINPQALSAYKIPLMKVVEAVRSGNNDVGGRLVEFSGAEYMVRGRGYAKSLKDLEQIVVGMGPRGTPVLIKNIAQVTFGPELRRGVVDLDGGGDVVGGIVVIRHGENALNVIKRVKEKMAELKTALPAGVEFVTTYDRSDLIERAIDTLKHQLTEEMLIVSLVIIIFLWNFKLALVPIITIPIAILLAFIPMYLFKVSSNIMSLAGIAISIGVLVDGAIIEVENVYKRVEEWRHSGSKEPEQQVVLKAIQEVAPAVFFSLLVIAVSFFPIFSLVDQEGRLFKPLAFTKNFSMLMAAILALTLVPAVLMLFKYRRGKYYAETDHPVSKVLIGIYEPICKKVLQYPKQVIAAAILILITTIPVYWQLGSEFMPPLNEGSILYMPTTMPGISVSEAKKLLQTQDQIIKSFPEVERVFGKAGRAETATDPAPLSMMETTILLKPQKAWRKGMNYEKLVAQMDAQLQIPGVVNAWTMPIKNRIDMLSTGIRTPVGIKIFGGDVYQIEAIGKQVEAALKNVRGTRSVFSERVAGGYFLDFDIKRDQLARYGLTVQEVQDVIATAIGGEVVSTVIDGRARYGISVRYNRDFRENLPQLKRVLVSTEMGQTIPLGQLCDIRFVTGPSMIRDENGSLAGYVYVDVKDRDIGSYVHEAKNIVASHIKLPTGYHLSFSGQYENMQRVSQRLKIVIPLTLLIIFLLIYLNTRSSIKTLIVLTAVPFSLVGAVWALYLLDFNISIAVWVGMIALMGLDAETGIFMLLFLDLAHDEAVKNGKMKSLADLKESIIHGAVKRIRPKTMTVMAILMGLVPMLWSTGAGADVMKRIAAPMIGGIFSSFVLELLIYPAIYLIWKRRELPAD